MHNRDAVNSRDVQRSNRLRVLREIRRSPETARAALSGRTGLSAASVSNIAGYLLQTGLIVETGREHVERTGRKGVLLRFDGARYRIVTASLADGAMHLYLTDLQGVVYAHTEYPALESDPETTLTLLRRGLSQMLDLPQARNALAVGVSVSALVLEGGRRVTSARLGWKQLDLKKLLSAPGGPPLFVTNSSFTKAGWLCRTHPEWSEGLTLFVNLTRGIGAALLRGGERVDTMVGEIGHSPAAMDGELCSCGKRGCLEAMCSPKQLLQLYAESGKSAADLKAFSRALDAGDADAQRALDDCAGYLSMAMDNCINLFNPDRIVLNAEDYADCPALPERVAAGIGPHVVAGLNRDVPVFLTRFDPGDLAQAMAAELCDALFSPRPDADVLERIDAMVRGDETQPQ